MLRRREHGTRGLQEPCCPPSTPAAAPKLPWQTTAAAPAACAPPKTGIIHGIKRCRIRGRGYPRPPFPSQQSRVFSELPLGFLTAAQPLQAYLRPMQRKTPPKAQGPSAQPRNVSSSCFAPTRRCGAPQFRRAQAGSRAAQVSSVV